MASSIYIVEDQDIMRQTLSAVLDREADFSVVGTSGTAPDALRALENLNEDVDLMLVDVSLPEVSGIDLVERLRAAGSSVRCLMLSGRTESEYVRRSRDAGADGFVLKGDPDAVLEAVRAVLRGEEYVSTRLKSSWENGA